MKNLTVFGAFLIMLGVCALMQGVWMFTATDPMTIAPVFKLIGGLALMLGIVVAVCLSLMLCVGSFVYAFRFGDDEGDLLGLGAMGLIAWFLSFAFLAQTNVLGEPITIDADFRFAVVGCWVLVFALAALRAWVSRSRKARKNS